MAVVPYLGGDGFDFDDGKLLAVAALALHALALLLLEDDDLCAALVFKDLGLDGRARKERRADLEIVAFAGGEHFGDFHRGAGFGLGVAVHHEDIALAHGELFALGLDSGFHKFKGPK